MSFFSASQTLTDSAITGSKFHSALWSTWIMICNFFVFQEKESSDSVWYFDGEETLTVSKSFKKSLVHIVCRILYHVLQMYLLAFRVISHCLQLLSRVISHLFSQDLFPTVSWVYFPLCPELFPIITRV